MAKALPVSDVAADTPIGTFAARVIETRAGEVATLAAKRSNGNASGVHDRRVAIRRLRTALEVFEPELPKRSRQVRKDLKRVFSALGPRRDADVALEIVRSFEAQLIQADLPGYRGILAALETARHEASPSLDKETVLHAGAESVALAARAGSSNGGTVASKALRKVIAPRLHTVQRDLDALDKPKKVQALHRLRIAAKRLRYALEVGAPALGPAAHAGAEAARDLQAMLGDIHDCDVLVPVLRDQYFALRDEDVSAVREGRRPPNAARYRGTQTVETLLLARRAELIEQATARRDHIAAALAAAGEELGLT